MERYRKPHQGTALRNGDWAHQLHKLLDQPIPRVDDGHGLYVDAGPAVAPGPNGLPSGASFQAPGAGTASTLSMVVCSYNQAPFIRETLESLVNQQDLRPGELEIILIDGSSTDGSVDIIKEYARHFAYVVSEPDRGQTHALKKGFARATGNILGWLCSDDILDAGTVRFILDYFQGHPEVEFMYGDYLLIGPMGELRKIRKEIPFNWFIWKYDHNYIPQQSAFWRRTLYEQVNGLDETFDLSMDGDLWARFAERTRPRHVRQVLAKARSYPQAKTWRLSKQSMDEHRRVCLRYGADFTNVPKARALRVLAKLLRVSWKLTTGCYWNHSGPTAALRR